MATVDWEFYDTGPDFVVFRWPSMGDDDVGQAVEIGDRAEGRHAGSLVLQAEDDDGAWGGATLAMKGSVDGSNFRLSIADLDGTAIAMTADAAKALREDARQMRPETSGGTGTDVDVYLFVRFLR